MEILPLGCGALVGVSGLVVPTGSRVVRFELCACENAVSQCG